MRDLLSDLRFALRTLAKSPVFAAVAVVSLALGIGANTAIFTLLDQVLLRLLPVKDAEQLVQLRWEGSHYGSNTGFNALSYPLYKDFRDRNQVFNGVICRYSLALSLGYDGQTERLQGELVSGNYFDVLGVKAIIGRTITPDDDRTPGGHSVGVLSYDFWQERFQERSSRRSAVTVATPSIQPGKRTEIQIGRSPQSMRLRHGHSSIALRF
jgi:hypothetical protein